MSMHKFNFFSLFVIFAVLNINAKLTYKIRCLKNGLKILERLYGTCCFDLHPFNSNQLKLLG